MKREHCTARAFLEKNQICFYFQPCWDHYEFLIKIPLGHGICNFIAPDQKQMTFAFKMANLMMKNMAIENYDALQMNLQLNQIFLPLAETDPYLFLYVNAYLQYLLDYAIDPQEALLSLPKKMALSSFEIPAEVMTDLDDCEICNLVANMILKSIQLRQKELQKDLDLILKSKKELSSFTPLQRLYLMSRDQTLSANYMETTFQSSLQAADVFEKEDYDTIKSHIQAENTQIVEMYELQTIEEVLRFELVQMLTKDITVKTCKYCGKYFIPTGRSDTEYCNRKIEGSEKTCREIGPTILFKEKHANDEIHKIYKTAYARMDSRKRQGMISKKDFNSWSFEAREKRSDCINGTISFDEFKAWLDQTRWRK